MNFARQLIEINARVLIMVAVSLFLMAGAQYAWAEPAEAMAETVESQESAEGHEGEAAAAEHHSSGGLPQLNAASWPSQIFWLAITFSILYAFFSVKTLPELSGVIENRKDHIRANLDEAESLKEKAENVRKAYEEVLAEARDKASAGFLRVEREIKEETAAAIEAFKENSQRRVQETEASISRAKKEALENISAIAAELASQAAHRIVGISTDIDDAKSVVQNINRKAA